MNRKLKIYKQKKMKKYKILNKAMMIKKIN